MEYAAYNDVAICAVEATPEAAVAAAKTAASGSVESYDADASERGLSGFRTAPISPDLAAHVEAVGGNIGWDEQHGVLIRLPDDDDYPVWPAATPHRAVTLTTQPDAPTYNVPAAFDEINAPRAARRAGILLRAARGNFGRALAITHDREREYMVARDQLASDGNHGGAGIMQEAVAEYRAARALLGAAVLPADALLTLQHAADYQRSVAAEAEGRINYRDDGEVADDAQAAPHIFESDAAEDAAQFIEAHWRANS